MSTRTHQAPTRQAPPRVLGLEPRWRDLPALAVVNTRAFGVYGRKPDRVSETGHAAFERMWRWRVWVALASVPGLLSLVGDRAAGWVAAVDRSSVMRVRPRPAPAGQRLQYGLGVLVATLPLLGVFTLIALAASSAASAGRLWISLILLIFLVGPAVVMIRDMWGRDIGRELPADLPTDLFTEPAYVGTGFCAYPKGSTHGQHLFDAVLKQAEQQRLQGVLAIRARNAKLAEVYARPQFGFERLDADDTSGQPVMYRRLG